MKRIHLIIISILLLFSGIIFSWIYYKYYSVSHAHYKNFGIHIPQGNYIHGIDVSKYQSNINWLKVEKMKSADVKLKFCFIKATEGNTLVDRKFERNIREVEKTNLIYGVYHFFRANVSPQAQASHFLKYYQKQKGSLPPVLDVESLDGEDMEILRKRAKEWLDLVEKKTKKTPILYANKHFFEQYLSGVDFKKYPKWVAHYGPRDQPHLENWKFWQHSDHGRVNGINHAVDFNVFNGDSLDLVRFLGGY